jgi:hypothetical protein
VTIKECARESEVVAALMAGRWPARPGSNDVALAEHVASCQVCQDVSAIASLMRTDMADSSREARIPSSAHVWWRTQLRARQEASRTVDRPMKLAHGFAAASAAGVAVAAVTTGLRWGWPSWPLSLWPLWPLRSLSGDPGPVVDVGEVTSGTLNQLLTVGGSVPSGTLIVATIVICLMLMPVAVYFALSEKS